MAVVKVAKRDVTAVRSLVEDSESSLKIVRSHDPLSENTLVNKTVCEHNGIPKKDTRTCIQTN